MIFHKDTMKLDSMFMGLLALSLCASGCRKQAAGGPGAFPPTQVVAVEARREPVSETLSLVGSIAANELVEIKSETDGKVEEINFQEGEPVEAVGWDGDFVEAQCFGFLAVRSLLGLPLSLPTTTAAPQPMTGGELWRAA